ncbi:MAG: flagellar hook-length control protein FliK [Rhizobiaceae bacterium]|nr:MAG: flagellar hook-length control protein FliK [Rhizobiaceae bacterium]
MTSGITPAALIPPTPTAKGGGTTAVAKAAGFSELLDKPAGGRARQSAHSSSSTLASTRSERQSDETSPENRAGDEPPPPLPLDASDKRATEPKSGLNGTPSNPADKDRETAADTKEKRSDLEAPKHKAVVVDVSAILFGIPVAVAANTAQSDGGNSPATSATTTSAGQTTEATEIVAGRKWASPATANTDANTTDVQANDNRPADTVASAAERQSPAHSTTGAASGAPSAAVSTRAAGPAITPTPAQDKHPTDVAATAQPQHSAKLQGVTVTASTPQPATPPIVTGAPQTTKAGTGKADDITSPSPNTGASADAAAPSDTAGRTVSAPPAKSSGRDTGGNAGSNGHDGGRDPDSSSSITLRNAGSAQTAGSAVFGGSGGTTAPILGQTASSFVSGMGTPQTWAAAMSQAAYMPYGPAMAAPVRSLSIALQPAELGTVTANLHLSGQQLRVDVEVRTEEALQRLSSDADDIVKSLRNLGFDVSHVTIRHGGSATPPTAGAGQAAGQPQGNTAFQASANSGGGHGGTTQGNAGKNDGNQDSQVAATRPSGGDGLSRGLYI